MKEWILLRGLMSEPYHWWDFLPLLKQAFPKDLVHLPHIKGTGPTGKKLTSHKISNNLKYLRSQLPPKEHPRVALGFSLGGMLAVEWARKFPSEIDALVLINCSFKESRFYHRMTPSAIRSIARMAREKHSLRQNELSLNLTTQLPKEKVELLALHWKTRAEDFPVSPWNFFTQIALATKFSLKPGPPSIPILLLSSLQDQVVHHRCSQDIASHWRLPLHIHPNAGHDLTLDDPHWVLEKITSWEALSGLLQK